MASEVSICNRALQVLGAKRITSLSQDSSNARSCNAAYEIIRDAELRKHPWAFAIKRATLAASDTAPDWGRTNSFPLPDDFIALMDDYPESNPNTKDWIVEGRNILTDDSDPLYVRYIARITDVTMYDTLFCESLALAMAQALCEEITQSNGKLANISTMYKENIKEAKKANAIRDSVPSESAEDTWITARL